ncbi:MAG: tetratricopeptide repeat protein [Chlamydiae bacterium]|nr:tetratricopeptide repeat protein [Chlamydiota bacterium]MBI3266421.1 tetratricopeptide repeat protein [Chlamydiota bacterium]
MKKFCLSVCWIFLISTFLNAENTPVSAKAEDPVYEKAYDLYNQAKYDDAMALFKQILEKDSKNLKAQVYYGVCFMGKEEFDQAIVELEKALSLDAKFPLTNYALSVSYARKSSPDAMKAEEYLGLAKKYGYQVPAWFEQYLDRLKKGKVPAQKEEKKP